MKFRLLLLFTLLVVGAQAQIEKVLPPAPNPPRLVNDLAGLLTEEQKQFLEQKLVAYDDSTSNQIAIVTVKTLNGYAAVDYATELGRKWGVGNKGNNNGVVVLVSTGEGPDDDGRDAFIAVGYGLEGAIPDITANTILRAELIPNLKNGDYFRAFDKTADALILAAAGEYQAPEGYRNRGKDPGISIGQIILVIIIISLIAGFSGRNKGGGGGFASRRGYRGFWGPPIIGGGFGSGRGWSGGGGGFGGGGFGGFGGGGFGGGGAGGRW